MKKKVQLLLALAILLIFGGFVVISGSRQKTCLELGESTDISIVLNSNNRQQRIYPWYNETDGRYYFFLPAYCNTNSIAFSGVGEDTLVFLDGMAMQSGSKFEWQEENTYQLEIMAEDANADYELVFLHSENLPAVFIATDSGNMEYIHQNKENEEQGKIDIVTADGNVEYSGKLPKISGRGNSTWSPEKKAYAIALQEERPLLGMEGGKKWCLLSGHRELAKMCSKIAFDLAELVDHDYSPQCTWVDLYLNGEYTGIYILSQSVSVGQGRVDITDLEKQNKANNPDIEEADKFEENGMKGYVINNGDNISGGYLIEQDFPLYWEMESAGFTTLRGNKFTIKSPQHASREQVEYISQYVQNIDDMLNDGNVEYKDYIDFESFARKFVVDEIALSFDVNVTSMFYYKKMDDDLLYAGPVWDFNGAFGRKDGIWSNYEFSMLDSYDATLNWYKKLYNDEVFRSRVIEIYSNALPRMEELIETKIDIYADYIRKSVELDKIRWADVSPPERYVEFDNSVRYLKFYLVNRLNWLNERWGVDYGKLSLQTVESTHEITFWLDEELIETRVVADGEVLEQLPYLDEYVYEGWCITNNDEKYGGWVPIYEDTAFYAKRKEE